MFLIALALAQAAPFDTKADYLDLARQHCQAEWPANFEVQGYCLAWQTEGMRDFKYASDTIGKPIEKALEKCVEDWTSAGIPNWQMIGYCARTQATAFRRLER